MDGVRTDWVRQLWENRREGKANDREEERGGEAPEQAGAQNEAAMEAEDQERKGHGCQQRVGRKELP